MKRKRRGERWLVGLLLLALLLIAFWRSVFTGRVLSPSDALFATPFFHGVAPAGFTHPSNELLFDAVYQFIPWRSFACESLRRGTLPLWNPHSLCGTPLVATMQSAVFYPVNLLLCGLPLARLLVWGAIVRLWVAGFGTYLLARRYALGVVAALVAAVSFMFCGFLVVWLQHPHVNVAVWLPTLILLVEILLQDATTGARIRHVTLLAVVVGIQFTGGHIETAVNVLFFAAIYGCVRWYQLVVPTPIARRTKVARVAFPAVAVVLGAGLAGVQLLPFLEWLPLSAELRRRAAEVRPLLDAGFWREVLALPLLVFPNLYNNPTWRGPYRSFLPWGNYNEQVLYVGIVTLLLAILAVVARPREPLVRCWAAIALLSLGMAFRLPGLDLLNRLPALTLCHPSRLRLVTSFSLCVLAGFGIAALCEDRGGERLRLLAVWRRSATLVVGAGIALAAAGTFLLPLLRNEIVARARAVAESKYAALAVHSRPLDYYLAQADELAAAFLAAFRADNLMMYAPVLWALGGLAVVSMVRAVRWQERALLALVGLDVLTFAHGYQPAIPPEQLYPGTQLTARVARDPALARFTALHEDMVPDSHMMFGISDVRGLDFRTSWYDDYLSLLPERIPWIDYGVLLGAVDSPLLRVLNLKWVATARPEELRAAGASVVLEAGEMSLGELARVQPRSFMVYETVPVTTDADAMAALRAAPAAVYRRAVLAVPVGAPGPEPIPAGADDPANGVSLLRYEPAEASWRVETGAAGYLVTTDAYYPGWNAYLDERPTRLLRADLAFRAVYVPAGSHVVTFRYEPASVHRGIVLTLVSALVILGLPIAARRYST
jgi:hypothetical protein